MFNSTQKKEQQERKIDKDGKALYRLKSNAVYRKQMKNLVNRIDVICISNKKFYFNWTMKPSYMSHKIFYNDIIPILKNKATLTVNKPAYIGVCILELSKVLMYKLHYD